MKKENPYVKTERRIMDALVSSFNLFQKLEKTHPCHEKDFADGIHKCQNVIMHRIIQRDYPNEFPTYKKENK